MKSNGHLKNGKLKEKEKKYRKKYRKKRKKKTFLIWALIPFYMVGKALQVLVHIDGQSSSTGYSSYGWAKLFNRL